ncbi:MAG: sensor histidine kinase [Nostoc sp.]|uniref:sensor histidine kinase n=1 Tax=Nostoc sp. TaxID=1180 RepID=UPI002FF458D0
MLFALKFQPNPFRFLVYTEWVMLTSCGSLAVLEAIAGRRLPLQHISVLMLLCVMGWVLPTGKSSVKILYTFAQIGLIFYGTTLGYLHILPTLYLIVFIRTCFLFGMIERWAVGGMLLVLFLLHQTSYVQNMTTLVPQLKEQFWMHLVAETLMFGLGLFLVLMLVNTLLSERQAQKDLATAHQQLTLYASQAEELATAQERNRIARDIHDSLGHALTALNVQLQTAVLLWQQEPVRAEPFLQQARRLGVTAMQEVRKSVQALREDNRAEQSLTETIAAVVDDFRQGSGIETQMQIIGQTAAKSNAPMSAAIVNALYRIVQEALTNIYKYARATAVTVEIETTSEIVRLSVVDNGCGFNRGSSIGIGFGLQGMQERIAALGGTFTLETEPGRGCRIGVEVPLTTIVPEMSSS